ncbi:hypothetical protein AAMO2058_000161200 [Amorphochlora amoebiformis]
MATGGAPSTCATEMRVRPTPAIVLDHSALPPRFVVRKESREKHRAVRWDVNIFQSHGSSSKGVVGRNTDESDSRHSTARQQTNVTSKTVAESDNIREPMSRPSNDARRRFSQPRAVKIPTFNSSRNDSKTTYFLKRREEIPTTSSQKLHCSQTPRDTLRRFSTASKSIVMYEKSDPLGHTTPSDNPQYDSEKTASHERHAPVINDGVARSIATTIRRTTPASPAEAPDQHFPNLDPTQAPPTEDRLTWRTHTSMPRMACKRRRGSDWVSTQESLPDVRRRSRSPSLPSSSAQSTSFVCLPKDMTLIRDRRMMEQFDDFQLPVQGYLVENKMIAKAGRLERHSEGLPTRTSHHISRSDSSFPSAVTEYYQSSPALRGSPGSRRTSVETLRVESPNEPRHTFEGRELVQSLKASEDYRWSRLYIPHSLS